MNGFLPDISRISAVPWATWQDLGICLRAAGFDRQYREGIWQRGMRSYEHSLQRPLLLWHLRREHGPNAVAHRMFMLRDPVTEDEAVEVLGRALLEQLFGAGVLIQVEPVQPGCDERPSLPHVVSTLDLRIFRGLQILCDDLTHRGDAVFGVGPGTAALYLPRRRPRARTTALDVGCGAGAAALWLSAYAERVVAADINARALAFVEINAAINGVTNVEVRHGDLFEAVAGESFDIIFSQPPYVPLAPGVAPATYLFGGPRGDEILRRLLSDLPPHLAVDGRALLVFDHAVAQADDTPSELTLPFDAAMRTLLILGGPVDADAYSIRHAAPELRHGVEAFARAATGMREHLERVRHGNVCPAICVLEHAPARRGWVELVRTSGPLWNEVSAAAIDRLFAGLVYLHEEADGARAARVRIPAGSLVVRPFHGHEGAADSVVLGLPPEFLVPSLELEGEEWEMLRALHRGEAGQATPSLLAKAARAGLIDE